MLNRLFRRALRGAATDFTTMASKHVVLHEAETVRLRPAIYADDALDRIERLSPWCTWDKEMLTVEGGMIEHAATEAFTFKDVRVSGPFLYRGAAQERHGFGPAQLVFEGMPSFQDLDSVHLVTNWPAVEYFGQYLLDNFPLEIIPSESMAKIGLITRPYLHAAGYRDLLALPAPREVIVGRCKQLTLNRDFSQNSFKAARYRQLRARLRTSMPSKQERPLGVFLRRGATGERRILANEAEIEARLASIGFDIIVPAELDAAEIAQRTLDAPIVISVEGSHLSHAIFTVADDGAFLVLQPPNRFAMAYKEFADALDIRFAFIVGSQVEDGFTVDLGELEKMIDKLEE